MLNRAKNQLEDAFEWAWLETTSTGAAPLTISDLKSVRYVTDTTNDRQLYGMDVRDVSADIADTGSPSWWWLDGLTTLKVWPVQTVTLSVRYLKYSPELSAGGDTPLIPVRYHAVWVDLAVVQGYKDSDNFQAAAALMPDLNVEIAKMIETYGLRDHQGPAMQQLLYTAGDW